MHRESKNFMNKCKQITDLFDERNEPLRFLIKLGNNANENYDEYKLDLEYFEKEVKNFLKLMLYRQDIKINKNELSFKHLNCSKSDAKEITEIARNCDDFRVLIKHEKSNFVQLIRIGLYGNGKLNIEPLLKETKSFKITCNGSFFVKLFHNFLYNHVS